ncbi:hypothetical protein DFJ74DRAFT_700647 [Hyaloraphidium curvatum]|nr:hypothetical protein DFJ74DRAFT_700647 [Hyaloraphidium curvatum]
MSAAPVSAVAARKLREQARDSAVAEKPEEHAAAADRPAADPEDGKPKALVYETRPWTADEDQLLKQALKKFGIPAPTSDSLRRDGLWYSTVSSWTRIVGDLPGRSPEEARYRFFGPLNQEIG